MAKSQETKLDRPVVYIIDEEDCVRDTIAALLRSQGIEASHFSSAEEFLQAVDGERPGCVITEIQLPGMSGLQLLRELRERAIGLPVIALTSSEDVSAAVSIIKAGAVHLIEKPFLEHVLLAEIRRALALAD